MVARNTLKRYHTSTSYFLKGYFKRMVNYCKKITVKQRDMIFVRLPHPCFIFLLVTPHQENNILCTKITSIDKEAQMLHLSTTDKVSHIPRGRRSRIVLRFTTTCAISPYHH